MKKILRLQQGQVWKAGAEYLRIVQLERLEVGYKSSTTLPALQGKHKTVTKKEFCRLLKGATLLESTGATDTPAS
jgi:hypothetical protein